MWARGAWTDGDLLTAPVQEQAVPAGERGQRRGRRGGDVGVQERQALVRGHPAADVLVGRDHRPVPGEALVAAHVVEVPVRVDHQAHRSGREGGHGGLQLAVHLRVVRIHQEDAALARASQDLAAGAGQHEEAVGQGLGLHLEAIEVLGEGRDDEHTEGENEGGKLDGARTSHGLAPGRGSGARRPGEQPGPAPSLAPVRPCFQYRQRSSVTPGSDARTFICRATSTPERRRRDG